MNRTLDEIQLDVGGWAHRKGWDFDAKATPEKIALMHSELSEALEEYRAGHAPKHIYYSDTGKPEGIPIELADTVIRIMHYCDNFKINLEEAIEIKMAYNETRPFRHGKVV